MESSVSIQDFPEEILLIIAQFLGPEDINACINVCQRWRIIFNNSNKIWRRFCFYQEKHFKTVPELCAQFAVTQNVNTVDSCTWRKCFDHQKKLWDNLSKGKYAVEQTNVTVIDHLVDFFVDIDEGEKTCEYFDEHGNHWFFLNSYKENILLLNTTRTSNVYHSCINDVGSCKISSVRDKLFVKRTLFINSIWDIMVFEFKHPEYNLNLLNTIEIDENSVLQDDENSGINIQIQSMHFIIDHFLVTYDEEFLDIQSANIHIWDLEIPEKMPTQNAFQQSYVDFVLSTTGNDIRKDFSGGILSVFYGDSERVVVCVKELRCKIYQVSLFSLCEMRFTSVVGRLDLPILRCEIKDDIVALTSTDYRACCSCIFLYSVNGQFITRLNLQKYMDFPRDIFWFCGSHLIQKVDSCIRVTNLVDCIKVHEYEFEINVKQLILGFIYPKFLLLYNARLRDLDCNVNDFNGWREVSVWDIDSGTELWKLDSLVDIRLCHKFLKNSEYPGKLLVLFEEYSELSVLNFEK